MSLTQYLTVTCEDIIPLIPAEFYVEPNQIYEVKVVADSVSEAGVRLVTLAATYPRFIHDEMLTHTIFRNSGSSRAQPSWQVYERVRDHGVIPVFWGKNQSGMEAETELPPEAKKQAREDWIAGMADALQTFRNLSEGGAHKQIVNRSIMPYDWITCLITATDWQNFRSLRVAKSAQPEMQVIAHGICRALDVSQPTLIRRGEWHLPYVTVEERERFSYRSMLTLVDFSVARCARLSYYNHEGTYEPEKDVRLSKELHENRHVSPMWHQATPMQDLTYYDKFWGWKPYRKFLNNERGEPNRE